MDDEDIFQPSLTASDDVEGFGEPFYPPSIPFVAFFAGPIGAGYLVARNFRHLGMGNRVKATVGWFALLTLLCLGLAVFVRMQEYPARVSRLITQILTIAWTFRAVSFQSPRFRVFQGGGGEPKPLFWHGVLTIVLGIAAYLVAAMITYSLYYTSQGIEFQLFGSPEKP